METGSFEEIIRENQQKIYRVVFSLVRNEAETDEIVQQTFVQAFKAIKNFRGDASIGTWLTRIAINNARAYFRKRKFLSFLYDSEGKAAEIRDDKQNTEKSAESEATKEKVKRAIAKLPARQKEVFVLKHIDGLSIAEISKVLGIAEGTVKANIFKAIKNLKKNLEVLDEMQ